MENYTKYALKSAAELKELLADHDNIFVIACNKCFHEFTDSKNADCQEFLALANEMGKTVTDESGRITETHKISWTYDFHETFGACGGDARMLAALLFPPAEKRWARDGKYYYDAALRQGLLEAYYKPLQDWCLHHGIALTGHPAGSHKRTRIS